MSVKFVFSGVSHLNTLQSMFYASVHHEEALLKPYRVLSLIDATIITVLGICSGNMGRAYVCMLGVRNAVSNYGAPIELLERGQIDHAAWAQNH